MQHSKYYLIKWGRIEQNASQLNKHLKKIAYLLFSAMNEMTDKERQFLADKYQVIISGKA